MTTHDALRNDGLLVALMVLFLESSSALLGDDWRWISPVGYGLAIAVLVLRYRMRVRNERLAAYRRAQAQASIRAQLRAGRLKRRFAYADEKLPLLRRPIVVLWAYAVCVCLALVMDWI